MLKEPTEKNTTATATKATEVQNAVPENWPKEWPKRHVVRTSTQSPTLDTVHAANSQSITIRLDGERVRSLDTLADALSQKLALPAFTVRSPERLASAVDRRLFVMEKAKQYVTVILAHTDATPKPVLAYLLDCVSKSPLRLVLAGHHAHSEHCLAQMQSLGIELLDIDPPLAPQRIDSRKVEAPDIVTRAANAQNLRSTKSAASWTKTGDLVPPELAIHDDQKEKLGEKVGEKVGDEKKKIGSKTHAKVATPPGIAKPDTTNTAISNVATSTTVTSKVATSKTVTSKAAAPVVKISEVSEPASRRWYLVACATALTVGVLWYAASGTPTATPATPDTPDTPEIADISRTAPALSAAAVPIAQVSAPVSTVPTTATTDTTAPTVNATIRAQPIGQQIVAAPSVTTQPVIAAATPAPRGAVPEQTVAAGSQDPQITDVELTFQSEPTAIPINGYTLQVGSYADPEVLKQYLLEMRNRPEELRAAESNAGGRIKNLLVYGAYPDYASAANAVKTLPAALQTGKPFPINVSKLKR